MDYKLNSSFLPRCLLPENDTSRVWFFLFVFSSVVSHSDILLRMGMYVCTSRGFDFGADRMVVQFVRRFVVNGHE